MVCDNCKRSIESNEIDIVKSWRPMTILAVRAIRNFEAYHLNRNNKIGMFGSDVGEELNKARWAIKRACLRDIGPLMEMLNSVGEGNAVDEG